MIDNFFKDILIFFRDMPVYFNLLLIAVLVIFLLLNIKDIIKKFYANEKAKFKVGPFIILAILTGMILFLIFV